MSVSDATEAGAFTLGARRHMAGDAADPILPYLDSRLVSGWTNIRWFQIFRI